MKSGWRPRCRAPCGSSTPSPKTRCSRLPLRRAARSCPRVGRRGWDVVVGGGAAARTARPARVSGGQGCGLCRVARPRRTERQRARRDAADAGLCAALRQPRQPSGPVQLLQQRQRARRQPARRFRALPRVGRSLGAARAAFQGDADLGLGQRGATVPAAGNRDRLGAIQSTLSVALCWTPRACLKEHTSERRRVLLELLSRYVAIESVSSRKS